LSAESLVVLLGLLSAGCWGAGDFVGGLASRRRAAALVVAVSQVIGTACLLVVTLALREPFVPASDLLTSALAGAFGGLGLLLLYRAMSGGNLGVVAPVSGLTSAVVPVTYGILREGLPEATTILGVVLAFGAVWLVSGGGGVQGITVRSLAQPIVAGLCFGLYLVFLDGATGAGVLWPVLIGRLASIALIGLTAWRTGALARPTWPELRVMGVAGILDTTANTLFAFAAQLGRLDVASVLGSLYPASTVALAWLILKERLRPLQWVGVGLALAAIVLLTV
jgi:drug/metabolite transporter (DMT)-like permease